MIYLVNENYLENAHGITIGTFNHMKDYQKNKCAICGDDFSDTNPAKVDHDHATGLIRGLLCDPCNLALGLIKDSIPVLESSIKYLKTGGVFKQAQKAVKGAKP